jgi:hypothetical protein
MKKVTTTCDACGQEVVKFYGHVTVEGWGATQVTDACSPACLAARLHQMAGVIEDKEGIVARANAEFIASATISTSSRPCACEHAARRTWKNADGVDVTLCTKCQAVWMPSAATPPVNGEAKRRGRKLKEEPAQITTPVPAPERVRERSAEPPRWCGCGAPLSLAGDKWRCVEQPDHEMPVLSVKQGLPGENLSQLCADAEKASVHVNLAELATWPVLQRDTLREWLKQGAKSGERPHFLPSEWDQFPEKSAKSLAEEMFP